MKILPKTKKNPFTLKRKFTESQKLRIEKKWQQKTIDDRRRTEVVERSKKKKKNKMKNKYDLKKKKKTISCIDS